MVDFTTRGNNKKRKSSKEFFEFAKRIKEVFPDFDSWTSIPIYLREYKVDPFTSLADYGVQNNFFVRTGDKNRKTLDFLYYNLKSFAKGEKTKLDKDKLFSNIWRFLDLSLKKDKDLGISETSSLFTEFLQISEENENNKVKKIQEELDRLYYDEDYYPNNKPEKIKELKELELKEGGKAMIFLTAFDSYNKRDLTLSDDYVPLVLINKVRNSITFTDSEKRLIDWVEYNLPGTTNKFISAILNQNEFISINYFLPQNILITRGEQQKLFRYRKLILNKFQITVSTDVDTTYVYSHGKRYSGILNYNCTFMNFIESIIPGYKENRFYDLTKKIKEYKKKLNCNSNKLKDYYNFILEVKSLKEVYKKSNDIKSYDTSIVLINRFEKYINDISSSQSQLLASFDEVDKCKRSRKIELDRLVSALSS